MDEGKRMQDSSRFPPTEKKVGSADPFHELEQSLFRVIAYLRKEQPVTHFTGGECDTT